MININSFYRLFKKINLNTWMVVVLLFSFGLRIYGLDYHDLWGDEAFSVSFSKQNLALVLSPGLETHPPLYHLLLHIWIRLTGDTIFAMRYLSVLSSVSLVAITFTIGKRLSGSILGLIASIMIGVSSFSVYYSQEVRMYTLVVFFCTVALYADLKWEVSGHKKWLYMFIVIMLFALFTHYYSLFILIAHNVYKFHTRKYNRHDWGIWINSQIVLMVLCLPWILAQSDFVASKAIIRWDQLSLVGINNVWFDTLMSFGIGNTVSTSEQWLGLLLFLPLSMGIRFNSQNKSYQRFAILYWTLVPLLCAFFVASIMPFYYSRYLILILPAYLILVGQGIRFGSKLFVWSFSILFLALNLISLNNYFFDKQYAKGGYGQLMNYIHNNYQSSDAILLQNGAQDALYKYYSKSVIKSYNMPPWNSAEMTLLLDQIKSDHHRLWLIMYGDPAGYDPDHMLENWLHQVAYHSYHGDYVDGSLDLFVQADLDIDEISDSIFDDVIKLNKFGVGKVVDDFYRSIPISLEWTALANIDDNYTMFVHLIDENDVLWSQVDSQPLGGTWPTSKWINGETVYDKVALTVKNDVPSGLYRVVIGWYNLYTMERLSVKDVNSVKDQVELGVVRIP
ncbi:MAG TPA: hypothetical protein DCL76_00465 [Chloroflexi bacterium]|nr:hypothetical protein [Chloroflexota bacterium]